MANYAILDTRPQMAVSLSGLKFGISWQQGERLYLVPFWALPKCFMYPILCREVKAMFCPDSFKLLGRAKLRQFEMSCAGIKLREGYVPHKCQLNVTMAIIMWVTFRPNHCSSISGAQWCFSVCKLKMIACWNQTHDSFSVSQLPTIKHGVRSYEGYLNRNSRAYVK